MHKAACWQLLRAEGMCLFFLRFTSAQLDRFYICDVCKGRNEYSWSHAAWLEHAAFTVCIVCCQMWLQDVAACWPGLNEKCSIYEDSSKCMNRFVRDSPLQSKKKNHLSAHGCVNGGLGEESTKLFSSFTAVSPHTQVNDHVHRGTCQCFPSPS